MSFRSLACAVSVQCQEIKQALASISYFDTWDSDVIAECCRVSSVVEYASDRIIIGPGTGTSHTVYFVLEGVCRMVQDLRVEVRTDSGRKTLRKLHRFCDSKAFDSASTNDYSSRLFSRNRLFLSDTKVDIPTRREEDENREVARSFSDGGKEVDTEEAEAPRPEPQQKDSKCQGEGSLTEAPAGNREEYREEASANDHQVPKGNFVEAEKQEKDQTEVLEWESQTRGIGPPRESKPKEGSFSDPERHLEILEECKKKLEEATWVCKKGSLPEKPKNVECFFVQTGFLFRGASFGLEKHQKEHFIMSTTKVKCLKIPRRFLLKHNPCYTWDRIGLFRSLRLPREEQILESLRRNRRWIKKKEEQSADVVSSRSIPNYTLINDVPYSLRLETLR